MTKGEKIKPGKSIIKFIQCTVGQYLELIINRKNDLFYIIWKLFSSEFIYICTSQRAAQISYLDVFVIRLIITQTPCSNSERFIVGFSDSIWSLANLWLEEFQDIMYKFSILLTHWCYEMTAPKKLTMQVGLSLNFQFSH